MKMEDGIDSRRAITAIEVAARSKTRCQEQRPRKLTAETGVLPASAAFSLLRRSTKIGPRGESWKSNRAPPKSPAVGSSGECLLSGFGEDGGGRYSGRSGGNGYGSGRCRERIELAGEPGAVGDYGIGVREGAPGATVGKGDAVAGNRISVLVGDFHREGLGQLRSRRSGLIIAAGDHDIGSGASNGILGKSDVLEAC